MPEPKPGRSPEIPKSEGKPGVVVVGHGIFTPILTGLCC